MKYYIKFIKNYLNLLSVIAPKAGGRLAAKIFQKVRHKNIKKRESPFYKVAKQFKVNRKNAEAISCYEMGNSTGKLVFLIHGWDSNAGSLYLFAKALVKENYRVISLDFPAHANAKETHTNLYICKEALREVIEFINPQDKFSLVTHSFGSSVSSFLLAENSYNVDKIVFLSANNKIFDIFKNYQKMIGFNDAIFKQMALWSENVLKEKIDAMNISDKLKKVNFEKILIIHDKFDKVIPFKDAIAIEKSSNKIELAAFEKIGHYRMLWNDRVVQTTIKFLNK